MEELERIIYLIEKKLKTTDNAHLRYMLYKYNKQLESEREINEYWQWLDNANGWTLSDLAYDRDR